MKIAWKITIQLGVNLDGVYDGQVIISYDSYVNSITVEEMNYSSYLLRQK